MDYESLDDEALIRLIAHARKEALSVLYDRYSRLVFSMAIHTVGDHGTAEEITQDVFFRVWEKAYTYRAEQAKVSTWLASITRYRAIDILRQRGVRPEQHSIGWNEITLSITPSDEVGPEEQTDQAIERRRVRSAILTLPPEQQQALALAYYQGLTHSEIADRLKEPLGTIKTRIRLGMQKLREVLRDDLLIRK